MGHAHIHIGEMLARNGRMYPREIALVERIPAEKKRDEITWKQFDERVNRFANILIEKGVQKGEKERYDSSTTGICPPESRSGLIFSVSYQCISLSTLNVSMVLSDHS